jgi:hypothetical protein|mmetsp:Transcript_15021/g.19743  ORF Transcript_15021/g.19743 Transcript_15021/m.19743 type:complete len:249 (-) Transcript_15021:39-785(-)
MGSRSLNHCQQECNKEMSVVDTVSSFDFSENCQNDKTVQDVAADEDFAEEVLNLIEHLQPKRKRNLNILCGRSKLSHHNEGNKWFRSLIAKYREPYQAAQSRLEKTRITVWIMNSIIGQGGKFLILDDTSQEWGEADEDQIKSKISHSLRSVNARNKKNFLKRIPPPKKEQTATVPPEDRIDHVKVRNMNEFITFDFTRNLSNSHFNITEYHQNARFAECSASTVPSHPAHSGVSQSHYSSSSRQKNM